MLHIRKPPRCALSLYLSICPVLTIPGLVYLPNYLNEHDQKRMIKLSLRDIPAPPNRNSLDAHYKIPTEGLWHHYAANTKTDVAVPRAATEPPREMPSYYAPSGERPLINNQPSTFEALKQIAREHNPEIPPSPTVKPLNGERAMYKLRWTNIGHYYHWGLKQYDFSVRDPQTAGPIAIPQPVAQVCKGAVEAIPWQRTCVAEAAEEWKKGYKPDAGIINYYNLNVSLCCYLMLFSHCTRTHSWHTSIGARLPPVFLWCR